MSESEVHAHTEKGFTLIELLVVVAIIGILSSVVLAAMNNARQKGRDARRQTDLKNIKTALLLYNENTGGSYPIQTTTTTVAADASTALTALVSSGLIATMPVDPTPGKLYFYVSNTTGSKFCLGAEIEQADALDLCESTLSSDIDTISAAATYKISSE